MSEYSSLQLELHEELFGEKASGFKIYAIVDGALWKDLPLLISQYDLTAMPLYSGEISTELRSVLPYLVELNKISDFIWTLIRAQYTQRILFIKIKLKRRKEHTSFFAPVWQKLLLVPHAYLPEGSPIWFRFYDPRIFPVFMKSASPGQLRAVYGDLIDQFIILDGDGGIARYYRAENLPDGQEFITLTPEQIELLNDAAREEFTRAVHNHIMNNYFADGAKGNSHIYAATAESIDIAYDHGLISRDALRRFAVLAATISRNFYALPAVSRILSDRSATELDRMQRIESEVRDTYAE